jgi:hypothetical protein
LDLLTRMGRKAILDTCLVLFSFIHDKVSTVFVGVEGAITLSVLAAPEPFGDHFRRLRVVKLTVNDPFHGMPRLLSLHKRGD